MAHGDPALWWTLDPQRKALALGWLGAEAQDRLDAQKKQKKHKTPGPYMGIPGLEVEPR